MRKIDFILTLCISALFCLQIIAQDSWRFINIPDYHKSEGLSVQNDAELQKRIEQMQQGFVKMYQKHGGELITIPGDIVSGHWYNKKFVKRFTSEPKFTNYTTSQVVAEACKRSFGGLKQLIHNSGYEHLLVAVGDHEIGDNPWGKGKEVVKHIPTFREEFGKVFTKDVNGNSRFTEKIGNAPARPIGTIYEHTSNSVQYKNVLFITLDMFRFDDENTVLGNQGVVSGDITGEHLAWLTLVLKEAQAIKSIDHIVVQSHLPIIYPVRKYASSGMLVDDRESEKILDLFRTYNVDLYLAGEVHMNTLTKDAESDLIQFVGRGNNLSNLTAIDVEKDKLTLTTFHENGEELGYFVIDKSTSKTNFKSSGLLNPVNPKGLQIHWSFDELLDDTNYKSSVEGIFPKIAKQNKLLSQMKSPKAFNNHGDFNYDYSLINEGVSIERGMIGNAAKITTNSKLFVLPIGPLDANYERTLSTWVKTTASGRQIIFNSASFWGKGQFFNMSLNEGNLELALRPNLYAHTKGLNLNDGTWHHLAIVLPKKDGTLNDIEFYIDGNIIVDKVLEGANVKINTSQANWMSIATHIPAYKTDVEKSMQMSTYQGLLDDFCIWTRGLKANEIKNVYEKGLKGISALEVENKEQ
ncbi:hypothetical protein KH5_15540 [Urechidicola sp. KH5]